MNVPIVYGNMLSDTHRERISRALSDRSPQMSAARRAGYRSLRDVAYALDADPSFLSKCFRSIRSAPMSIRLRFEVLTAFSRHDWRK